MASPSTGLLPADFHLFSVAGIAVSVGIFLTIATLYTIGSSIYNVYFHPLSHIPGPFLARACNIPYNVHTRDGSMVAWIQTLHKKYGDAVRVNPTEVSFISGETAWQDIYGFRIGKHKTGAYLKDHTWYLKPVNDTFSLIGSDEANHSRMRRNLSHAFSDKALRQQETLIQGFVDLLVQRLGEISEGAKIVDIMRWYNYTTFDIITDLTFGEPLYCLRDQDYHPWVNMVFASVKAIGKVSAKAKSPMFHYYDKFLNLFIDTQALLRTRVQFFHLAEEKVSLRLDREGDRPDFISEIVKSQGSKEKALTRPEIDSNAVLFLIAGSETTATLLSGVTYLLLKNQRTYAKLVAEIRGRFKKQSEITIDEVNNMEYLIACLQEALRYYPPVPTGFPRVVPRGGDTISGKYIPEGTAVYVSQHATNHSTRNYTDPDSYIPERWMGDERYKDDNRASLNPFSFGPRNCLGKNLAFAEMRLILAKVLFNFDLELVDKTTDWMHGQKVFTLWEKPSLMITLHPVTR
ncbi:cytochrome P450 monooxygenase-like protein [Pleomassaria siparia CBS 279.74]|uniref:Cytochrome P450 monooxygenase-like protein n=1 Tax=Pleomassaria siparia CBS 279.74 TaxID=1314801 RepID=A0A6G1KG99_9PLEO|nr:cytochrome P450 monooxygenase-like protein [Pleomassaria siparia CBS 279.74]